MLSKLRSYRPSHAVVVAYLALFVALGGSSYAAITVTGKNVKNSSLTGKDIKNNSLTGRDVKGIKSGDVTDHSLLAKDFKTGQVPPGPKGDRGPSGATSVVMRSSTDASTTGGNRAVSCNPGERAVGGGVGRTAGGTSSSDTFEGGSPFTDGSPTTAGSTPTAWDSGVHSTPPSTSWTWYAICVAP